MILKIDDVDIIPYIAEGGIKWQRADIDAPNTGRALDALMYRGRISTKIRLDITCRPLLASELNTVLNLILPEFVTVNYSDPMYGLVTKTMYSNNNPATFLMIKDNGDEMWNGITFPLVER
jgi:hypothetical protein